MNKTVQCYKISKFQRKVVTMTITTIYQLEVITVSVQHYHSNIHADPVLCFNDAHGRKLRFIEVS